MRRPVAPPLIEWSTVEANGRTCFEFPIRLRGDRQQRFTVAQRIADRYRVEGVLARGGGGIILEATDERTGGPVLVKALAEYNLDRDELLQPVDEVLESLRRARHHLQTERRILVQLRNAGCTAVPQPIDYVFDVNPALMGPHRTRRGQWWRLEDAALLESEPYLVMQRVPGTGLQELLGTEYRHGMPPRRALEIIDDVAAVIERLHRPWPMPHRQLWQLVYQDLKPSNILIGWDGHATLLDFGGCQVMINGVVILEGSHTTGYCAPECQAPNLVATPAADGYALGTTLFHMLTGTSPRRLLSHIPDAANGRSPVLHLGALPPRCSPELVSVLRKALDPDPRRRFPSAAVFRAAIAPLLHDGISAKRSPSAPATVLPQPTPAPSFSSNGGTPSESQPPSRPERLIAGKRTDYEVGERLAHALFSEVSSGRKLFWNFRHEERALHEAAPEEGLAVVIRSERAEECNPRARAFARQRLQHECLRVLPAIAEWTVPPIDLFEHDGRSILITARPSGDSLQQHLEQQTLTAADAVRVSVQMIEMLGRLHAAGLFCGGLWLDDFRRDATKRLVFTATDRVFADEESVLVRRFLPEGFRAALSTPPEVARPVGPIGRRADLYSWAALTVMLLLGEEPKGHSPLHEWGRFEESLRRVAAEDLAALAGLAPAREFEDSPAVVAHWADVLKRSLSVDADQRPADAAALRDAVLVSPTTRGRSRRFFAAPHREAR